jgi:hypothetical protein
MGEGASSGYSVGWVSASTSIIGASGSSCGSGFLGAIDPKKFIKLVKKKRAALIPFSRAAMPFTVSPKSAFGVPVSVLSAGLYLGNSRRSVFTAGGFSSFGFSAFFFLPVCPSGLVR